MSSLVTINLSFAIFSIVVALLALGIFIYVFVSTHQFPAIFNASNNELNVVDLQYNNAKHRIPKSSGLFTTQVKSNMPNSPIVHKDEKRHVETIAELHQVAEYENGATLAVDKEVQNPINGTTMDEKQPAIIEPPFEKRLVHPECVNSE